MILRDGMLQKGLSEKIAGFTSSVEKDAVFAEYDIRQSRVHARGLKEAGYISESDLTEIESALDRALEGFRKDPSGFSAGHDDIHMAVEAAMGEPGKKLHAGRSRNDQVACDMRMYLRDSVSRIIDYLETAVESLRQKDLETGGSSVYMPAYTHLQRGQAVNLSTYLGVYRSWFGRDIERFRQLRERINRLPLGAAAGASTGIKLDVGMMAEELGFDSVIENSMDAVSSRDHILEFASACALMGVNFSRLAEEFVLFASREFSFIELDDSIAETSSIMPQKKNPDCLELIRGAAGRLAGISSGLVTVMKGLPLTYNRDMQEDRMVIDAASLAESIADIIPDILRNISFNTEKMGAAAREGFTDAADMAEYLVGKGMDFRSAHQAAGRLARVGLKRGYGNFSDFSLQDIREEAPLADEDVFEYIRMENAVERRFSKR